MSTGTCVPILKIYYIMRLIYMYLYSIYYLSTYDCVIQTKC